jgi:hypothetical protein
MEVERVSLPIRRFARKFRAQEICQGCQYIMLIELRLNQIEHCNSSYSVNHCCASFVTELLVLRL